MPIDRRYVFAVLALVAVVYICYKYTKYEKKCNGKLSDRHKGPTVKTKFNTKIIPLKPPRNDSFSKALPIHYKFNYSDSRYDDDDENENESDNEIKENDNNNDNDILKVLTFNVLATCYALRSSSYQSYCPSEHLKGEHRFIEIGKILKKCDADIIALQEVDDPQKTLKWMDLKHDNKKYKIMYQKRTNKKQDGLILGFKTSKYELYNNNNIENMGMIKLNDLTMGCSSENSQEYFKKDQIAIYILLHILSDPTHILFIFNTHLYWHPDACNVRLRQISYLLNIINFKCNKLRERDKKITNISLIFCGDFNMLPLTSPHQFILNGKYLMRAKGNSPLKLIMDSALNKVARWTRSLGVDCNYFGEQKLNTETANKLFTICNKENRILITRSKRLVARRECPNHLLLNNHIPRDNLKQIIKYFAIQYDDNAIFTRCTLCNGLFKKLTDKIEINDNNQIPKDLKLNAHNMTFWKCLKCQQIYWFGQKSQSEVEKFKRIFNEISIEIHKETKESKEILKKRLILLKKQKQKKYKKQQQQQRQQDDNKYDFEYDSDIGSLDDKLELLPNLQRFFWENVEFMHPFKNRIKCSYQSKHGKSPEYTNKTNKFKGCLDYIFYADLINCDHNKSIKCIDSQLMEGDKTQYPNSSWPSDHILTMSTFKIL